MIKTSSEIRLAAREALKVDGRYFRWGKLCSRWTEAVLLTYVYNFIIVGFIYVVGLGVNQIHEGLTTIAYLLLIPMFWGYMNIFLLNARREEDPFDKLSYLFVGYKDIVRILSTYLLCVIYTFLWTLLLVVPGIIKGLSYSMTNYILYDYPELKNNDAIELSMKMMEGHKAQLFWLHLSFIGWYILCLCSFGIGVFFLEPYIHASMAEFYEQVKNEYHSKQV